MSISGRLDRVKAKRWLLEQFSLPDLPDEIDEHELDALEACVFPDPQIARIEALHFRREGVAYHVCNECSAVAAWATGDVYSDAPWPCRTADLIGGDV